MKKNKSADFISIAVIAMLFNSIINCYYNNKPTDSSDVNAQSAVIKHDTIITPQLADTILYSKKMQELANGDKSGRWPVKASYPARGALLPFNRIVAYYGNFYSTGMGVLGEYSPGKM